MDLSLGPQRKRQHRWVDHPTISQQENDDTYMEIICPSTKRSRLSCECYAASPDVISDLDTLECNTAMDFSVNHSIEDRSECAVAWWKRASAKQAQQTRPMLAEDDLVCRVCDSVYKKHTTIVSSPFCRTVMPENSILAYFKCKSKIAARSIPSAVPVPQIEIETTLSTSCTFCERYTCQDCLEPCERCQNQFCRFCMRNDYFGNHYSRVHCLDCADDGLRRRYRNKCFMIENR